jgi:hypothetical protein
MTEIIVSLVTEEDVTPYLLIQKAALALFKGNALRVGESVHWTTPSRSIVVITRKEDSEMQWPPGEGDFFPVPDFEIRLDGKVISTFVPMD